MTAKAENSQSTAVATKERTKPALAPEREAQIAEARARTEVAKAIRGAIWGKDLHPNMVAAVVAYCRQNNLDAVRHVEVLGGRIYLTATFYDEKGAHLLYSGDVIFQDPDFVNADPRLDELVAKGDEWAVKEKMRRLQERIRWNVPEAATAAVVTRATLRSGMTAIGVNWCGGGTRKKMGQGGKVYDADPIGDLEPSKTAQTRSRRRAWVQIADMVPSLGQIVKPIQESAKTALPVAVVEADAGADRQSADGPRFGNPDDPYMLESGDTKAQPLNVAESDQEILRQDSEIAASDES